MSLDSDFAVIDVETANSSLSSICQLGLVLFKDGKVQESVCKLVDPEDEFDGLNISIHGITPEMVKGQPRFPAIHHALQNLEGHEPVLHHTSFDRASLNQACAKYALPELKLTWLDTARVARRQWPEVRDAGYGLADLAHKFSLTYKAHDAAEDARAAGEIFLRALAESHLSIAEWLARAYRPNNDWKNLAPNPDGDLYGEKIVFTGTLSMTRAEAAQVSAQSGCEIQDSVNKHTTILVVGDQASWKLSGYEKSAKHRKAEEFITKGKPLRIIGETDFLQLVKIA